MKSGDADRMLALSTPRVREKLQNEFSLSTDGTLQFEEWLYHFSSEIQKRFSNADFFYDIPGESDQDLDIPVTIRLTDGTELKQSFHLCKDESGNWKNDSRL